MGVLYLSLCVCVCLVSVCVCVSCVCVCVCVLHSPQVIVYHPRQLSPEQVMERVHRVSSSSTFWNTAKAAVATLMLPVAWGVDVLIIPGPSVGCVRGEATHACTDR
jgi:hypothetical protein